MVSPYVGMAQKQYGVSSGCISNYTTITLLGTSVTHFEALFCSFRVQVVVHNNIIFTDVIYMYMYVRLHMLR